VLFAFLSGAIAMGFIIAGLFFLRAWRRVGDSLFLTFAAAFWLLGTAQTLLTLADVPQEERSWLFLLRLAAFTLILSAIIFKNRAR